MLLLLLSYVEAKVKACCVLSEIWGFLRGAQLELFL